MSGRCGREGDAEQQETTPFGHHCGGEDGDEGPGKIDWATPSLQTIGALEKASHASSPHFLLFHNDLLFGKPHLFFPFHFLQIFIAS